MVRVGEFAQVLMWGVAGTIVNVLCIFVASLLICILNMLNGAHFVQEETGWNKAVELFQYAVVSGMELGSLSPQPTPFTSRLHCTTSESKKGKITSSPETQGRRGGCIRQKTCLEAKKQSC